VETVKHYVKAVQHNAKKEYHDVLLIQV